ncbi:hypothetical protein DVH24_042173 [Malus domestica]|uniref:Uncharacterized protein n=1 Tax=Malus domestica TaxID=3750 RepID=A0A498J290_MALDO|nr:hypothetical protein DVH24_042173 [Malus domestica]
MRVRGIGDGDAEGDDKDENEQLRGSKWRPRSRWGCKRFSYAFQELVGTVDLESPVDVCDKELALAGERIAHKHAEVQNFNDDDVVIYTPKGDHIGMKRKVRYIKVAANTRAPKGAKTKTTLENMTFGDTHFWKWLVDKEGWLSTNTYCQYDHTVKITQRATKGRKP